MNQLKDIPNRECPACGQLRSGAGMVRVGKGKKAQKYLCTNKACAEYDKVTMLVYKMKI
jgi:ssDNA-binding Zn-finger/Zn-ribbon topoisomerase 1